jgi:prepilin-type N-terminal cleavage/methylation domain-containing protein
LTTVRAAAHTLPDGAFSLVELLIVLALLLILTVMGTNHLTTSAQKRELASCAGNLQKIYLAMSLYREDNGAYPCLANAQTSEEPLSLLVPKCTTDTEIFICPGSGDSLLPQSERFTGRRISYDYYMGRATNGDPQDIILSDWQVDTLAKKRGRPIFSADGRKPGNNHAGGGNLLSLGGTVQFSAPKADRDVIFPSTVRLLAPKQ